MKNLKQSLAYYYILRREAKQPEALKIIRQKIDVLQKTKFILEHA